MTDECGAPDSSCDEVLREVATYLDGELTDAEAGKVVEHLGDCPPCKDRADLEACVKDLLRSRCADSAPPALIARLEAFIGQQTGA